MKYKEDKVLEEIRKHVEATYKKHYASDGGLQVLDVWEALGSFDTSCRDAALKYIWRFGKKEGYNKEDVLKAIHFLIYIYQYHFIKEEPQLDLPLDLFNNSILRNWPLGNPYDNTMPGERMPMGTLKIVNNSNKEESKV